MLRSLPPRHLAGILLLAVSSVASAQTGGFECQVTSDGTITSLIDTFDDLQEGVLDGEFSRACAADFQWPGTYVMAATSGSLRVADMRDTIFGRSITTTDRQAGIVLNGFPPNANSFSLNVHGANAKGRFVNNTRMRILVKGTDGSILWSTQKKMGFRYFPLGGTFATPISSVEVGLSSNQPEGVEEAFPVVDLFTVSYDSGSNGMAVGVGRLLNRGD